MTWTLYIIAVITIFAFLLTGGAGTPALSTPIPPGLTYDLVDEGNRAPHQTLQLSTLTFRPRPTVNPVTCNNKVAVNLLLDTSGSMNEPPRKIQSLKAAVNSFFALFKPDDVVGVQRFSSDTGDIVPIDTALNLKSTFASQINAINPNGSTHIKDGMQLSEQRIAAAKTKFPDFRNWVLIVVTDGSPNPWPGQDPRSDATRIKQSGVRIITIGIELGSAPEVDAKTAIAIMENVASSPTDFYQPDASQLPTIYNSIARTICR